MTPAVSVVMSTYRRPERLVRAVASVREQTYQDWELIVVHDGPDNLDTLAPTLATNDDDRVRGISLPEHFGCGTRPKNAGVMASRGRCIAFLDDDNAWRPNHLDVLVAALDAAPERVCLVYGDRLTTDERGGVPPVRGFTHDFDRALLMRRNYIDTSDALIRREALFEVGGMDERVEFLTDWNLWVRLAKAGYEFQRVPLILTDYYLHTESMTGRLLEMQHKLSWQRWDPKEVEIQLPYLGAVPDPRVGIYTLTYDRLRYTQDCFPTLYAKAGYPFDHCIVDNGSSDGTPWWLDRWQHRHQEPEHGRVVAIILNPRNFGISKGNNQAVDRLQSLASGYDILIKVDNDAYFLTDNWLRTMVDIWKRNRRIALSCYVRGLRENVGGAPRVGRRTMNGQRIGLTRHLGGISHFVDASAYEEWRWPEDAFLHGGQDSMFSAYLRSSGYEMGYLEDVHLEHYRTTAGQHEEYPDYFERREIERRTRYVPRA